MLDGGGAGARVINGTAELISTRLGEDINKLNYIEYYEMDTATPEGAIFANATDDTCIQMSINTSQINDFRRGYNTGKHGWADQNRIVDTLPDTIITGANKERVVGKFAFLCNYSKIKAKVLDKLTRLGGTQTEKTTVYIVANTVSGTGSGCFVDIGMMVQDLKRLHNELRTGVTVTLIITIATGTVTDDMYVANSHHALWELDHYMTGNPYFIDDITGTTRFQFNEGGDPNKRPFDNVYLVGSSGGSINHNMMESLISEYIYNDIFSTSAAVRDARRGELKGNFPNLNVDDKRGQRPLYTSFGLSTIEYPYYKVLEAATNKYIIKSVDEWKQDYIGTNHTRELYESKNYYKNDLYSEMIREVRSDGTVLNYAARLAKSKDDAERDFGLENNVYDSRKLSDLVTNFYNGLQAGQNYQASAAQAGQQSIEQGDINEIIDRNYKRLKADLPDRIKEHVLNVLFSADAGAVAKSRLIIENIRGLLIPNSFKPIDSASQSNDNGLTLEAEMDGICGEINALKSRWIPGFKKRPMSGHFEDFMVKFNEYAEKMKNDKISEKLRNTDDGSLIAILRGTLDVLELNINNFENSITAWKNDSVAALTRITENPPLANNGHIVYRNKIAELAEQFVTANNTANSVALSKLRTKYLKDKYYKIPPPANNDGNQNYSGGPMMNSHSNEDFSHPTYQDFLKSLFTKIKNEYRINIKVNVIDSFFEEQAAEFNKLKADGGDVGGADNANFYTYNKIREVENKSMWFLNVDIDGDDDYHYKNASGSTVAKWQQANWIFYPDGLNFNNAAAARDSQNKFAKILEEYTIIANDANWGIESQDNNDKTTILFLREKGWFPVRHLEFIADQSTKTVIGKYGSDNYFSRKDIKSNLVPMIPESADVQTDMKMLLVKALASKTIVINDGDFKLNRELLDKIKANLNSAACQKFRLPLSYQAALSNLCTPGNGFKEILEKAFDLIYGYMINRLDFDGADSDFIRIFINGLYSFWKSPADYARDQYSLNIQENEVGVITAMIKDFYSSEENAIVKENWDELYGQINS